jgi:Helix-turn-helix domain
MTPRNYNSDSLKASAGDKFFPVSQRLIKDIRYKKVSKAAKAVYVILGLFADEHGTAFPSYKTIAYYAGISERSAKRAIKELQAEGLLIVTLRPQEGKRNNTNIYKLLPEFISIREDDRYYKFMKSFLYDGIFTVLPLSAKIAFLVLTAFLEPGYDDGATPNDPSYYKTEITITALCEIGGLSWPCAQVAVKQLLHTSKNGHCIFKLVEQSYNGNVYRYEVDGPGWHWLPDALNAPNGILDIRRANYSIYENSKPPAKKSVKAETPKKIKRLPISFDQARGVFLNIPEYQLDLWAEAYPNCDISDDLKTLARLQFDDPKTLRRLHKGGPGQAINNYLNKLNRERRGQV